MIIQRGTLVRLKKQGGPIHHSFRVSNAFSLGSATNKQCKSCQRFSCQVLFKWCVFFYGLYSWQSSKFFSFLLVIAVKQFSFIIPKKSALDDDENENQNDDDDDVGTAQFGFVPAKRLHCIHPIKAVLTLGMHGSIIGMCAYTRNYGRRWYWKKLFKACGGLREWILDPMKKMFVQ